MTPESYFTGRPLQIGTQTQLLLDDALVEDRWRLQRVINQPDKFVKNPILARDKPWEGDIISKPSVLWDDDMRRYRMWYQCSSQSNYFGAGGPIYYTAYAESDDGFTWSKPLMEICPLGSFDRTNVVYCGATGNRVQGIQVWKDDGDPDPQRRYKAIGLDWRPRARRAGGPDDSYTDGINLICSPDGLHWTLTEGDHILDVHSDCANNVAFDTRAKRWLLYCRPIHTLATGIPHNSPLPAGLPGRRNMRRRISVMTSPDFKNWTYPRTCLYPDERDTPDYDHCSVYAYGSHFLMLYAAMDADETAWEDVRLASSRDGFNWERFHGRDPFIPLSEGSEWDAGQIGTAYGPPVRQGENLLVYYSGRDKGQHVQGFRGGIGVAVMRADRYVEQRAEGAEPGFLLSRELVVPGNRLYLNTKMDRLTYKPFKIRVELTRHAPIGGHRGFDDAYPGFSLEDCDVITGDRIDNPVTWNGSPDLSSLIGKPVYIRFEIQNMGLYAFRFANLENGALQ